MSVSEVTILCTATASPAERLLKGGASFPRFVTDPYIEAAVKSDAPANCHFITVLLQRDFWKDQKCVFRTDSRLRLTCIPTLMRWPRSQEKLQEAECANPALLKMLFEADD
ncbi:hypothetical protein B566_EDAN011450 [Ephemera danica]|nr:hypothetical protein B566_EDAN011450 [Ephemera danica]